MSKLAHSHQPTMDEFDRAKFEEAEGAVAIGDHYLVLRDGRVFSKYGRKIKLLKPHLIPKNGYLDLRVTINGKSVHRRVHQLVAEAFLDKPSASATMVCHIDGNPANNHVDNLYWGTASTNALDAVKHGTSPSAVNARKSRQKMCGERAPQSKLTWDDVKDIRRRRAEGETLKSLGSAFGVHLSNIALICSGKSWLYDEAANEIGGRKIITDFVYPPIPVRHMDWQAHMDGDEPNDDGQMTVGRGATEAEAVKDLIEQIMERKP